MGKDPTNREFVDATSEADNSHVTKLQSQRKQAVKVACFPALFPKVLDVFALASIVVVETDPVARERIARELRELGYAVTESAQVASVQGPQPNPHQEIISAGGVSIDTVGHRVIVDGDYVTLAPREYRLMLFLLSNQDRVFSRQQLLVHVWDRDASLGSRTVDVHIRRLRSVLEPYGYDRYVQTVRGTGYRFSLRS